MAMNKKAKIVIGVIIAVVAIIIIISLSFPPVFRGITSGTFGKADKYRKSQMTEKDIQLRSVFTEDTAQLRNMITGLIFFEGFTEELGKTIDSCVYEFWRQDLTSAQMLSENLKTLSDYSGFIKNNNKVLNNTINLLAGFYTSKNKDQSADVEKTLRDFGNYVNNLAIQDSILEKSLRSMDNFMFTNKKLQAHKAELFNVKSIRDQLLIKVVQLGGLVRDKKLCSTVVTYSLNSQKDFDKLLAPSTQMALAKLKKPGSLDLTSTDNEKLTSDLSNNNVTFSSADELKLSLSSTKGKDSKDKNKVYVYNSADLSFHLVSAQDALSKQDFVGRNEIGRNEISRNEISRNEISRNEISKNEIGSSFVIGVIFANVGLNLVNPDLNFNSFVGSHGAIDAFNTGDLHLIDSHQGDIGSFQFGSSFINFVQQLGKQDL
jgi:hypothetical protein